MTIIVLFGAPGSGKGTQGALIAEKYGFLHLSTGLMLRDEVKKGSELGKEIDKYISKGDLVPNEMMCSILKEELNIYINEKGIIFDGFPRTISQAEFLDIILKENGLKIDLMVDIQADEDILIKRLIKRGTMSHRSDDTHDTILKRLKIYEKETKPIIDYYKKTNRYNSVVSINSIEDTFDNIVNLIENIEM
ncbi:MAG: adenylate kinase [Porphyromonadaceae bacterium]|nr:adenylate kinase [Porphyromonadaceae bacterium]